MDLISTGFRVILDPNVLLWIVLGVFFGTIFGALPGVNATMAIVLSTNFTYAMDPVIAIAFLSAVYCAAITGGSITAILFKIPGTPSSAATVLDGYPMAKRGEAGRALGISLVSSAIGGLTSAILMFMLTQPLMKLALKFNSAEQFAVCFLGLSILIFISSNSKLNMFISVLIGLFIGTIGVDKLTGIARFTFGSANLLDGISILPFMLGMFAAAEIFSNVYAPADASAFSKDNQAKLTKLPSMKDFWTIKFTMLRSAILGTFVGIVPGAGANISSWLSYSIESKLSKHPEMMGNGDPHGICAAEAANNAATGGAMVPLLSMGIPGSNAAAMMMTALAIHGVTMGPLLLKAQPLYLSATFSAMIVANIVMVVISLFVAITFARILRVPYYILGTLILMLALTGCFAYQAKLFDIAVMIVGGIFGFFFKKYKFSTTALILGLVLGKDIEYYFRRALMMQGSFLNFFHRPIFSVIAVIVIIMYLYPLLAFIIAKAKQRSVGTRVGN
ncbi:MAG: tripartite tricarboxylate transporter permease [Sphaerochaetaceae bacterium]|nr:tripartite tricarboxylate transporter permease [Sphaerochaetaceae bacterium]